MPSLESILSSSGYRQTSARKAVFKLLESATEPLSIAEIYRGCQAVNRSSIYRTLDLFHQLDIINIVHVGWKKRYELAEPFRPHHHHLICNNCGKITAINPPELEKLINQIASSACFLPLEHHFEIYGKCKNCQ